MCRLQQAFDLGELAVPNELLELMKVAGFVRGAVLEKEAPEFGIVAGVKKGAAARFRRCIGIGAMLQQEPGHFCLLLIDRGPEGFAERRSGFGQARVSAVIEEKLDHLHVVSARCGRYGSRMRRVLKIGQSGIAGEGFAHVFVVTEYSGKVDVILSAAREESAGKDAGVQGVLPLPSERAVDWTQTVGADRIRVCSGIQKRRDGVQVAAFSGSVKRCLASVVADAGEARVTGEARFEAGDISLERGLEQGADSFSNWKSARKRFEEQLGNFIIFAVASHGEQRVAEGIRFVVQVDALVKQIADEA